MSPGVAEPNRVVIDVPETIGDLETRRALFDRLRALVADGCNDIVLNVAALTAPNTEQLGSIIQAYITVTKNGGVLRLVNVGQRLRRLMAITKVNSVIQTI